MKKKPVINYDIEKVDLSTIDLSKMRLNSANEERIKPVIKAVRKEVERAMTLHGAMRNAHEAYAVLLEEVDELWDEVKKNSKTRDPLKMREEAIQVAAMAVRMIIDVL